uniref:F-box domain-containing protein n=1 Tax=Haemonchus contortus TaxID=6289 RepID=A0A7I4YHD7_HAECO
MFSITYMTREFWFPAAFGRLSETERPPPAKRKPDLNSDTSSNYTKLEQVISQLSDHDLRLLADVSRKKCEQYLLEKRRFSTND